MNTDHLNALELALSHDRQRLRESTSEHERELRTALGRRREERARLAEVAGDELLGWRMFKYMRMLSRVAPV